MSYTATMQEAFDTMIAHLANQKCRSLRTTMSSTKACAYRGHNGKRCIIGSIIKDEDYKPEMEGHTAGKLLARYPGLIEFTDTERKVGEAFLLKMQGDLHDDITGLGGVPKGKDGGRDLARRARKIAHEYDLDPKVCDKLEKISWKG